MTNEELFEMYKSEITMHPDARASEIANKFFIPTGVMAYMNDKIKNDDKLFRIVSSVYPRFMKESCDFVTENVNVINNFLTGKRFYPLILEFHPGVFCNHKCEFCFNLFDDYDEKINHFNTIKPKKFDEVCNDCRNNGVKEIWFSGGKEPLTNADFITFLEIAHAYGFITRIYTNGVLLDPKWETLDKCSQIRISVNASTSDVFMKVCGASNPIIYDKLIEKIKVLVNRKKISSNFMAKIAVSFMVQGDNCHQMRNFFEKFVDIGVDSIQFRLDSIGRVPKLTIPEKDSVILQSAEITESVLKNNPKTFVDLRGVVEDEFNRELLPGIRKPAVCMAGMIKRGINPFSKVYQCEYSSHPHFKGESKRLILGNVNDESFHDIMSKNVGFYPEVCKFCQAHEYGMNVLLEKLSDDLKFGLAIKDQIFYKGK